MRKRPGLALTLACWLLAGGACAAPEHQNVEFMGNFRWTMNDRLFGGFSAIEIDEKGENFYALSDRSSLVTGRFVRDEHGRIVSVDASAPVPLTMVSGQEARLDSEGLALAPDGTLWISEENEHRVAGSRTPGLGLAFLPRVPNARDLERNKSFEALAAGPDGTLYTLPEYPRDRLSYPVYRFRDGKWDNPWSLPRNGEEWAAVGADIGPDGRFYLLEREFAPTSGFRSRVRAFEIGPDGPGFSETLLETPFRQFGNLEGLSVWRDDEDHIRLTMIADDAFSALFSTSIVEYRTRLPIDLARLGQ